MSATHPLSYNYALAINQLLMMWLDNVLTDKEYSLAVHVLSCQRMS